MFDELRRELHRLDGRHEISVTVTLPSDADGYFDRQCPSSECQFSFKIYEDDWSDKVRDEEVFCPFCGYTADSNAWQTQEQHEHAERVALSHIERRIGRAMKRDADRWNRRQPRNSLITMTMNVNSRPRPIPLPTAAESMQIKIICSKCECRYAVIGAAFFCPVCGHNAVDLMFNQSITSIRNALDELDSIRTAISDQDISETTARLLVENGLQHAVMAFQRYAEALYARYPSSSPPRRHAFQNLTEGSNLWHAVTGRRYSDYLTSAELDTLTCYFQQRHLLAHAQGIVDADYIDRTGDTTYRVGQRLVIRAATVCNCLILIEKLTAGMASEPSTKETET